MGLSELRYQVVLKNLINNVATQLSVDFAVVYLVETFEGRKKGEFSGMATNIQD